MDEQNWFVDQSGSSPVPYLNTEALTPFGGAQIATTTSEFDNFASGQVNSHLKSIMKEVVKNLINANKIIIKMHLLKISSQKISQNINIADHCIKKQKNKLANPLKWNLSTTKKQAM